jgi:chemotaxis signal transduction protein
VNATLETHSARASAVTDEGSRELVVFRLDAGEYALPVANVGEVLRMVAITPVRCPPAHRCRS